MKYVFFIINEAIQITYVNQNRYSYATHNYKVPSRFIDELPRDLIDILDSNSIIENNFITEFSIEPTKYNESITPGRKRLLERSRDQTIDWEFNQDVYEESELTNGRKVFHKKYGYGRIININGDTAYVQFDLFSKKQIFIKYLTPA